MTIYFLRGKWHLSGQAPTYKWIPAPFDKLRMGPYGMAYAIERE